MVCYYELKGWLVEVVLQMGKYTDSFSSFLFFFNLLLKSSHLLSMSFLDSGSKNKQRIINIRIWELKKKQKINRFLATSVEMWHGLIFIAVKYTTKWKEKKKKDQLVDIWKNVNKISDGE